MKKTDEKKTKQEAVPVILTDPRSNILSEEYFLSLFNYPAKNIEVETTSVFLDTLDWLTRLIWGEARGESILGKVAVGWVVRNRALRGANLSRLGKHWGANCKDVILARKQFSCINPDDLNYERLMSISFDDGNSVQGQCMFAAYGVMRAMAEDPTILPGGHVGNGADHYVAKWLWDKMMKENRAHWSAVQEDDPRFRGFIGNHVFFQLRDDRGKELRGLVV